ncbi:dienelactone hydrolase family protein [Haloechinothrix sp. LS1_15]|uniref:dienelactone hydrolase family protein n=1 Tax=Haloechinothrix sp. LS1_15 TaxID=2652248 RepID=UPI0029452805|nr:dienelactone hydrolase family protein [Haloechinothrix sp. LS1_15]MDV6012011.1 hypothetical protein [Haloechinothrix sp. LS1_15]
MHSPSTSPAAATAPAATGAQAHHHAHGPANRRRRVVDPAAPLFVRFAPSVAATAVVVLHDVRGLTDEAERVVRQLAGRGHLALAPIFYHDIGGRVLSGPHEAAVDTLATKSLSRLRDDIAGALDYTGRRCGIPARDTAVLGIGSGGYLAALAAAEYSLAAAAGVTPWQAMPQEGALALGELVSRTTTPWRSVDQDAEAVSFVAASLRA